MNNRGYFGSDALRKMLLHRTLRRWTTTVAAAPPAPRRCVELIQRVFIRLNARNRHVGIFASALKSANVQNYVHLV